MYKRQPIYNFIYPVDLLQGMGDREKIRSAQIMINGTAGGVVLMQNEESGEWFFALTSCGQNMLPAILRAHVILREVLFGEDRHDRYALPLDIARAVTVEDLRCDIHDPDELKKAVRSLLYTLKESSRQLASVHEALTKDAAEIGITA